MVVAGLPAELPRRRLTLTCRSSWKRCRHRRRGGWAVGGRWVGGGWTVGGRWVDGGWAVGGRWVDGGWTVGRWGRWCRWCIGSRLFIRVCGMIVGRCGGAVRVGTLADLRSGLLSCGAPLSRDGSARIGGDCLVRGLLASLGGRRGGGSMEVSAVMAPSACCWRRSSRRRTHAATSGGAPGLVLRRFGAGARGSSVLVRRRRCSRLRRCSRVGGDGGADGAGGIDYHGREPGACDWLVALPV